MEVTAREIMETKVYSVRPEMPVRGLATYLKKHAISGVPVIDAKGKLVGSVSLTDIVHKGLGKPPAKTQVKAIMHRKVRTIAADAPLSEVVRLMLKEHIHRLFVKQGDKMVGILTTFHLLRFIDDNLEEGFFERANCPELTL